MAKNATTKAGPKGHGEGNSRHNGKVAKMSKSEAKKQEETFEDMNFARKEVRSYLQSQAHRYRKIEAQALEDAQHIRMGGMAQDIANIARCLAKAFDDFEMLADPDVINFDDLRRAGSWPRENGWLQMWQGWQAWARALCNLVRGAEWDSDLSTKDEVLEDLSKGFDLHNHCGQACRT